MPAHSALTGADLHAIGNKTALVVASADAPAAIQDAADYVCDGTADEVQINAALAAAKKVVLSEGTFTIADQILIQQHGATLEGAGTPENAGGSQAGGGTLITCVDNAALDNDQLILVQRAADNMPVYGVTLRGFTVDGANLNTACTGIKFRSDRGLVENVYVWRCTGYGLWVRGYSAGEGGLGSGWATYDTHIRGSIFHDNWLAGFYASNRGEDLQIADCTSSHNGDTPEDATPGSATSSHGFWLAGSSAQVVNCHSYSNQGAGVFIPSGSARTKLSNCKIEHNKNGVYVNGGSETLIVGCGFKGNSKTASATTGDDNILLDNATDKTVIVGCVLNSTNDAGTQFTRYQLNIASNVTRTLFVANDVSVTLATPAINDASSSSVTNGSRIAYVTGSGGYRMETQGTATVASGSTSIAVTHNFGTTPRAQDIQVTPTNNPTNDPGWFWVDTLTSTQFTINVRANPGSGGATFGWQVQRYY